MYREKLDIVRPLSLPVVPRVLLCLHGTQKRVQSLFLRASNSFFVNLIYEYLPEMAELPYADSGVRIISKPGVSGAMRLFSMQLGSTGPRE